MTDLGECFRLELLSYESVTDGARPSVYSEASMGSMVTDPKISKMLEMSKMWMKEGSRNQRDRVRGLTAPYTELDDFCSDLSPLVTELESALRCPMCFFICHPPVWQCSNSHVMCDHCADRGGSRV